MGHAARLKLHDRARHGLFSGVFARMNNSLATPSDKNVLPVIAELRRLNRIPEFTALHAGGHFCPRNETFLSSVKDERSLRRLRNYAR
jgi:hypothetical protein